MRIKLTVASLLAVASFGLALAGSARPASAALITVDFTVAEPFSSVAAPFGMSLTTDIFGSFVYDTTQTGAAAFVSLTYATGTKSWGPSDLINFGTTTDVLLSGDTVTAFGLDFGNNNFVLDGVEQENAFAASDGTLIAQCGACVSITSQSAATPLPAALPLFATGIGALGLLGWRRKRKAQAVA
jgi:hypothetical protein